MPRRVALVLLLAGALLVVVAGAASAHTSSPGLAAPAAPTSIAAAAPGAAAPLWPWLAVLLLVPALCRRRAPQLIAAALVLVLVFFAAESAVHSVHHGLADRGPAVCPVASAAAHIAGTDVETVALTAPVLAPGGCLGESGTLVSTLRPPSPHQGRAPPSALA